MAIQSSRKWGLAVRSEVSVAGWFRRACIAPALALAVLGVTAGIAHARQDTVQSELAQIRLDRLPPEAVQVHRLIHAGGPFPYEKDGTVFGNRERRLPQKERGHYREYTVQTPGSRDRGARRIVCGGAAPTQPEACYYTADHYASFARIVP